MEGGAKGQVGGMEMGEEERGRLAGESRGWRCQGCGAGTNEEILREEEKRLRERKEEEAPSEGKDTNPPSASGRVKEQIPDELRFGFRDEMGDKHPHSSQDKGKGKAKEEPLHTKSENSNTDERRRPSQHFAGPEDLRSLPSQSPPPHPSAPPVHSPTPAPPTRTTLPSASASAVGEAENGNGVPPWVDKAIVGVIAGLVVMVVRKVVV